MITPVNRMINVTKKSFVGSLLLISMAVTSNAQSFVHPGLLHSQADLDRMATAVAAKQDPVYQGYLEFIKNPVSQYNYQMRGPLATVGRNPTVGQSDYDSDANAAHHNAVMWAITKDPRYAAKAIQIIDGWSATLQSVTGRDAILMAGLGPFKMVNAAEILRYTNAGWTDTGIKRTEQHFLKVIYPVLAEFAPFANGNWDDAALKTVMAIGVFCNDRNIFEQALRYYTHGWGNGSITHYIINNDGQVQETGRDQAHTQLGIGMLAECCEIAWHQGLDLYGYADNRLLKGFEYTAKYNLGYDDIPYVPMLDRTGKYRHRRPSDNARGNLRAVYEQVYHHYVNRMGLQAPYVAEVVARIRPEGPGHPGADHPGYGTLFYAGTASNMPVAKTDWSVVRPGGLAIVPHGEANALTWIPVAGATGYLVKRMDTKPGAYQTVATVAVPSWIDTAVVKGNRYSYTVSVYYQGGETPDAISATLVAGGLKTGWRNKDIGKVGKPGAAITDGSHYRIEAAGSVADSLHDALNYTYRAITKQEEITIQVLPQPSSQFSTVGLMIRNSLDDNSAFSSLMLYPGKTGEIEAPSWHLRLLKREQPGAAAVVTKLSQPLTVPAVTYGRLTGSYWLRISFADKRFTGWGSYDGIKWEKLGETKWEGAKPAWIGCAAMSNMDNSTTIRLKLPDY